MSEGLPFGVNTNLKLVICKDAEDAIARGYNYHEPEYKPLRVLEAVRVSHGMESGAASVDMIVQDQSGQKYVFIITSNLLKMVAG